MRANNNSYAKNVSVRSTLKIRSTSSTLKKIFLILFSTRNSLVRFNSLYFLNKSILLYSALSTASKWIPLRWITSLGDNKNHIAWKLTCRFKFLMRSFFCIEKTWVNIAVKKRVINSRKRMCSKFTYLNFCDCYEDRSDRLASSRILLYYFEKNIY